MSFIDKMENKIGRFAIKNLMIYLVAFYLLGLILNYINPGFYFAHLSLNAYAILHGEVWRIITYICYPPTTNILMFLLLGFIYISLGASLERVWGSFKFNLYIFIGIFANVIAAIIIYLIFGQIALITTSQLYLTMLLGMAATFPDAMFLLFFIVPVKAKWLGIAYGALQIYKIITSIVIADYTSVIAIVMSLLNFILFMFVIFKPAQKFKDVKRAKVFKMKYEAGSAESPRAKSTDVGNHRCVVCGITDLDAPAMEFRYCSKCNGAYEYCIDHLYTHVHIE